MMLAALSIFRSLHRSKDENVVREVSYPGHCRHQFPEETGEYAVLNKRNGTAVTGLHAQYRQQ